LGLRHDVGQSVLCGLGSALVGSALVGSALVIGTPA
jgi:hypothetical protein